MKYLDEVKKQQIIDEKVDDQNLLMIDQGSSLDMGSRKI